MAWYGHRRSGEPRRAAQAVCVGLGIAMVGMLAIQSGPVVRSGIDNARRSMDGATASLANFAQSLSGWSFHFGHNPEDAAKIAALEAEKRELMRWKDLAETSIIRQERYEQLLGLVGETQGQSIMARVVAEEDGPFAASRIANAGAANGVREGFAALNENGLVGRVVRVGEYTSRILLLTDYNSRIPVMGTISGDRALLVGDSNQGAKLEEAETPDKIVPGEVWVTSGDDGKMPLGVRVGTARKVGEEWHIDLAMQSGPVDFVRLAPPPDFAAPEDVPAVQGLPQDNNPSSLRTVTAPPATVPPGTQPAAAPRPSSAQPASSPAQPRPNGQGAQQ